MLPPFVKGMFFHVNRVLIRVDMSIPFGVFAPAVAKHILCDIKPGNLMIDSDAKLWITDFGLARIESDPRMTMTGDLIGTPASIKDRLVPQTDAMELDPFDSVISETTRMT